EEDGPVPRILLQNDRGLRTFHANRVSNDADALPAPLVAHLIAIARVHLLDVHVRLISPENRETPTDAAVVANGDTREHWLGCADLIPVGPDEMHDVADARQADVAMRVVC